MAASTDIKRMVVVLFKRIARKNLAKDTVMERTIAKPVKPACET
jgi:hypothetical protein